MKDQKRKRKKRSRAAKPTTNESSGDKPEQNKTINSLTDAIDSVSLEEANGDVNKATEFQTTFWENSEDPSTSTSSSMSCGSSSLDFVSSSNSSVGYTETSSVQSMANSNKGGSRQKKLVAVTGSVANVLGKEYARASQRKGAKFKEFDDRNGFDKEEVEQFLCSMLGDECELSMAVVRDVLCQYNYNVEKALDALIDLSAPSSEQSVSGTDSINYKEDLRYLIERGDYLTDRASDSTSHSSESDLYDGIWSAGYNSRNYLKVLTGSEVPSPICPNDESDLPQKVLESLFNVSKSPEHDPSNMNWRNVARKLQSLGPKFDVCQSSIAEPQPELCAKGDEYQVLRNGAKQHWESMRSYYQKASTAYSKGKSEYAAYLSDQGKTHTRLARVADEKASQDIFKARNMGIENVLTIDLHGQHVKPAMNLLKLHLLLGSYVPSVKTLRVITGCGSHGVGKSKLKQSVLKLVENEGMRWSEENRGTLLIKVDAYREFSFLECDSDSE